MKEMKIIGLTGGIGSGKTTLAKWFAEKNIPVYNSDDEAKKLINENPEIIEKLSQLFGKETYKKGVYNSKFVASQVFNDKELLEKLNQIVHPVVFKDFDDWVQNQKAPFLVKEAAILFESGSYKDCDLIISVVADQGIRIQRVLNRDGSSAEEIRKRMKTQWKDEQRIEFSDYVIPNNLGLEELREEFERVYNELLKRFESS